MVLFDVLTKWSHVTLLSTRNIVFAKLFAKKAHNLDYPIKKFWNISGSAEMNYLPSNVSLNVKSSLEGSEETGKGLDVRSSSRGLMETRALTYRASSN
jgi:hypothetical protein